MPFIGRGGSSPPSDTRSVRAASRPLAWLYFNLKNHRNHYEPIEVATIEAFQFLICGPLMNSAFPRIDELVDTNMYDQQMRFKVLAAILNLAIDGILIDDTEPIEAETFEFLIRGPLMNLAVSRIDELVDNNSYDL